jgi:hypothetical protein
MNNFRHPEVRAKRASKGDGRDYKTKSFEARRKCDAHLQDECNSIRSGMTSTWLDK